MQLSSFAKPSLVSDPAWTSSLSETVPAGGEGVDFGPDDGLLQGRLKNSKTLKNRNVLVGHLDVAKREQLSNLIHSHLSLFSDAPSQTHLIEHDIDVGDSKPIK